MKFLSFPPNRVRRSQGQLRNPSQLEFGKLGEILENFFKIFAVQIEKLGKYKLYLV